MFRTLFYLLGLVLVLTLARSVIGFVVRLFTGGGAPAHDARRPNQPQVPSAGVLRKCSGCGTYVSEALALRAGSGDKAVYYCSEECRRKV